MRVLVLDRLVGRGAPLFGLALLAGLTAVAAAGSGPLLARLVPPAVVLGLVVYVVRLRVHLEVVGDEVVLVQRRTRTARVRLRSATGVHVTATRAHDGGTVALHAQDGEQRYTALLLRTSARGEHVQPPEVLHVLADGLARHPDRRARDVSELLRLQLEHRSTGLPLRMSPMALILPDSWPRTKEWPA